MNHFIVFGHTLNGLEFVTYVIIPSAIVLVILTYIFFNVRLLKLSFDFDLDFLFSDKTEKEMQEILDNINDNKKILTNIEIEIDMSEEVSILEETKKEKV